MSHSFSDCFVSQLCEKTYYPQVNLSQKALALYDGDTAQPVSAEAVRNLINVPEILQIFRDRSPETDEQIEEKNRVFERYGFTLLSSRFGFSSGGDILKHYSVIEHPLLPGWVIKLPQSLLRDNTLTFGPNNAHNETTLLQNEEDLLRIAMANKIKKVAHEEHINIVVPRKYVVSLRGDEKDRSPLKKYVLLCEKLKVCSRYETLQCIRLMHPEEQIALAKKICTLIRKAGIVNATFHQFRFTQNGHLAIINTQPGGALHSRKRSRDPIFHKSPRPSIEKCARIGLYQLLLETVGEGKGGRKFAEDLLPFHNYVETEYKNMFTRKISVKKIVLSIVTLGLYPFIITIHALFTVIFMNFLENTSKRLIKAYTELAKEGKNLAVTDTLFIQQQTQIQLRLLSVAEDLPVPNKDLEQNV